MDRTVLEPHGILHLDTGALEPVDDPLVLTRRPSQPPLPRARGWAVATALLLVPVLAWRLLATVPQAAAQPTPEGPTAVSAAR